MKKSNIKDIHEDIGIKSITEDLMLINNTEKRLFHTNSLIYVSFLLSFGIFFYKNQDLLKTIFCLIFLVISILLNRYQKEISRKIVLFDNLNKTIRIERFLRKDIILNYSDIDDIIAVHKKHLLEGRYHYLKTKEKNHLIFITPSSSYTFFIQKFMKSSKTT